MAKLKCENCNASWDSKKGQVCPYCGTEKEGEIVTKTEDKTAEKSNSDGTQNGGTTIINNYYGEVKKEESAPQNDKLNARGEPVDFDQKTLGIFYQPKPKVIYAVVLGYLIIFSVAWLFIARALRASPLVFGLVLFFACAVPCGIYIGVKFYQRKRWLNCHNRVKAILEENKNSEVSEEKSEDSKNSKKSGKSKEIKKSK